MQVIGDSPKLSFSLEPLTPEIGAAIHGLDLAKVDDETLADLRQAWFAHQALFFPDQDLSPDALACFALRFALLGAESKPEAAVRAPTQVRVVRESEHFRRFPGGAWHSGLRCDAADPIASALYLRESPASGGDTLIASMYAAYEGLSERVQCLVSGLTALHSSHPVHKGRFGLAEHPLIRTHPETGRVALHVDPSTVIRVRELGDEESRALLDFLVRHATRPEYICRFPSRARGLLLWDHRCTQHMAVRARPAVPARRAAPADLSHGRETWSALFALGLVETHRSRPRECEDSMAPDPVRSGERG